MTSIDGMLEAVKQRGVDIFWEYHFNQFLIPQYVNLKRVIIERIAPAFSNIEEEAEEISQKYFDNAGKYGDPENFDPGDYAESAMEKGQEHFELMTNMHFATLNIFTTALFHLYEQHVIFLFRREILPPALENKRNLLSLQVAYRGFELSGFDLKAFRAYQKIRELQLCCNCIKHADGRSCEELKELNPSLFIFPLLRNSAEADTSYRRIYTPMAGEDIWVTEDDFEEYVVGIINFWNEFFAINNLLREEQWFQASHPPTNNLEL